MKAIVFDVDGTLLDTREFIIKGFEHVFEKYKIPGHDRLEEVMATGISLQECYTILAPDKDNAALCKTHRDFQEKNMHLIHPFKNTLETLQKLKKKGIQLAIVSSRKRTGLQSLKQTGIFEFLDAVLTGDDIRKQKPDPEGILIALNRLQVKASAAAMVGDTPADVEAGKNAGTITVAAAYGLAPEKDLKAAQPDYLINDISDIISLPLT